MPTASSDQQWQRALSIACGLLVIATACLLYLAFQRLGTVAGCVVAIDNMPAHCGHDPSPTPYFIGAVMTGVVALALQQNARELQKKISAIPPSNDDATSPGEN